MARPADPNSERSIAERLSLQFGETVTRKMVQCWQKKGYPLDDVEALTHRLRMQERLPFRIPRSAGSITIEQAARRERNLLLALVKFADGIRDSPGSEVADAIAFASADAYQNHYGELLDDAEAFIAQLRRSPADVSTKSG